MLLPRLSIFFITLLVLPAVSSENADTFTPHSFKGAALVVDKAQVEHGKRLSTVLNCSGCHTESLEGQPFPPNFPVPSGVWATNITQTIPDMADDQLEALLREGKHPGGRDMWFMPSAIFNALADRDMTALIAYLRTVPSSGVPTPEPTPSPYLLEGVGMGTLYRTSDRLEMHRQKTLPDLGEEYALGKYIVSLTCTECHGPDLNGLPPFSPDLQVAAAYSSDELVRLLRTGEAKGGRRLGVMSEAGQRQFSHLTARERSAVVAYLQAWLRSPESSNQ